MSTQIKGSVRTGEVLEPRVLFATLNAGLALDHLDFLVI